MEYNEFKNKNSTISVECLNMKNYQIYNIEGDFCIENINTCKDYILSNIKKECPEIIIKISDNMLLDCTSINDFVSLFRFFKNIHTNISFLEVNNKVKNQSSFVLHSNYSNLISNESDSEFKQCINTGL